MRDGITANKIFKSIEEQKQLLDDAVAEWMADSERMQKTHQTGHP